MCNTLPSLYLHVVILMLKISFYVTLLRLNLSKDPLKKLFTAFTVKAAITPPTLQKIPQANYLNWQNFLNTALSHPRLTFS